MRRVPLWLAIGGTALGTLAGMSYGMGRVPVMFGSSPLLGVILSPLPGFGASSLALRVACRPKPLALAPAESPARPGGGGPR